jgi:hypothetical protein
MSENVPAPPVSTTAARGSDPQSSQKVHESGERTRLRFSDYVAGFALFVAVGSALVSFTQLKAVRHQLQLAELQIRPYVRYKPRFEEKGLFDLSIEMRLENFSGIPANVIYHELRYWLNEQTGKSFIFNRTSDIVYQNKAGVVTLPPIPTEIASAARSGTSDIMISSCVIYGSIAPMDSRRWEVKSLFRFVPGNELPEIRYLNEGEVAEEMDRCDSMGVLTDWKKQLAKPPSDGGPARRLEPPNVEQQ